jgi:3-ketoacyl-CoA synthase
VQALRVSLRLARVALIIAAAVAVSRATAPVAALHRSGELAPLARALAARTVTLELGALAAALALAAAAALALARWRRPRTYLLDFHCFRPPARLQISKADFIRRSAITGFFTPDGMDFQERIMMKSGLSDETHVAPALHFDPPRKSMALTRAEAEMVMFGSVQELLKSTGISARQIDVLVTNCSLFNPTPSLAAMVINHFGMRSDVDAFSLGGMGCSAGILAVDLARKLLGELGRGGYALVVSTENISQNWYTGNERPMLIPNTIFRVGAAAIMLTNKRSERRRARYELEHVVRVHLGADEKAFRCVYQHEDAEGNVGVELNQDLVKVAARALETNLTRLGPRVLPWAEKLAFAASWVARKGLGARVAPYVPDFKRAFDHFCIHAGGRGVVEGLGAQLGLPDRQLAPSANTLHWYGNTSSSTVWYSFGFIETAQGVARGARVWQVGFGSGFKCNSAVWRALRPVRHEHAAWSHVHGREGEALVELNRIAAETRAERAAKAAATAAAEAGAAAPNGAAAKGAAANGAAARVLRGAAKRA